MRPCLTCLLWVARNLPSLWPRCWRYAPGSKEVHLVPRSLHWLPHQIHVLLARVHLSELKGLIERLDEPGAHHLSEYLVAAVQQLPLKKELVTALWPGGSGTQGARMASWKKKGRRKPPPKVSTQFKERSRWHLPSPLELWSSCGELLHPVFLVGETRQPGVCQCPQSWPPSSYSGQHF